MRVIKSSPSHFKSDRTMQTTKFNGFCLHELRFEEGISKLKRVLAAPPPHRDPNPNRTWVVSLAHHWAQLPVWVKTDGSFMIHKFMQVSGAHCHLVRSAPAAFAGRMLRMMGIALQLTCLVTNFKTKPALKYEISFKQVRLEVLPVHFLYSTSSNVNFIAANIKGK